MKTRDFTKDDLKRSAIGGPYLSAELSHTVSGVERRVVNVLRVDDGAAGVVTLEGYRIDPSGEVQFVRLANGAVSPTLLPGETSQNSAANSLK